MIFKRKIYDKLSLPFTQNYFVCGDSANALIFLHFNTLCLQER